MYLNTFIAFWKMENDEAVPVEQAIEYSLEKFEAAGLHFKEILIMHDVIKTCNEGMTCSSIITIVIIFVHKN